MDSGTDYARSAFRQLIEDIRNGEISKLITKDLSRLTNMIICAILKQAERYYNYIVSKICHTQFYTVKSGALMFAGNCAAVSVFL